ncbi:MAG: hypothetical protein KC636_21465, partial [Myxococcales bacterium]|nr:hypothetical protein [Myxococcales bacterium]
EGEEPFAEVEVAERVAPIERIPALAPHEDDAAPVERAIENAAALDPFFAALTRTELRMPGAITRATHYGDSAIGNDGITAAIRGKLQARFGDAGHGFHLLGQPNLSYKHKGVSFQEKAPWSGCFIIFGCRKDGYYGVGGTTFQSTGGAEIKLGTAAKGPAGRKVSRFTLWYAAQPRGGNLRLKVDDEEPIVLSTKADALADRWHTIEVVDGAHALSVRAAGGGKVRAYGVSLERDGPGVVWDGMSQIGAYTRRMLHYDEEHFLRQLRARKTHLVVLMFGGNDMNPGFNLAQYKADYAALLRRVKAIGPDTACLVMAPLDHGEHKGARIVTRAIVPTIVEAQREVAIAEGCGFWDTYQAMGGEGSMGRWARADPKLGSGDLAHLTHHGHKVIGAMLYRALMASFREYRGRVVDTPLVELGAGFSGPPGGEGASEVISAGASDVAEETDAAGGEAAVDTDDATDTDAEPDGPGGAGVAIPESDDEPASDATPPGDPTSPTTPPAATGP